MSAHPDVLVVGGGVIGCACALRLAQDGLRVHVLDGEAPGRAASWAAAGIVDPVSARRRDPIAELRRASCALYPEWIADLRARSGIDPEFRVDGGLTLITSARAHAAAERACAAAHAHPQPAERCALERIDAAALSEREPALAPVAGGALLDRRIGQVRPPRLLRALRAACRSAGVVLESGARVDELCCGGGRVTGVSVGGAPRGAGAVLLAAGAWSTRIGSRLAGLVDVHPVRGQMVAFSGRAGVLRRVILVGRRYLVPRADGLILAGSTEEPEAGFESQVSASGIEGLIRFARECMPALGDVSATWAGLRPATRDRKPILGPVPGLQGLHVATGHFRNGIALAPITAAVIACGVQGVAPPIAAGDFAPGRGG